MKKSQDISVKSSVVEPSPQLGVKAGVKAWKARGNPHGIISVEDETPVEQVEYLRYKLYIVYVYIIMYKFGESNFFIMGGFWCEQQDNQDVSWDDFNCWNLLTHSFLIQTCQQTWNAFSGSRTSIESWGPSIAIQGPSYFPWGRSTSTPRRIWDCDSKMASSEV